MTLDTRPASPATRSDARPLRLATALRAAVLAGLVAGGAVAAFHLLVTEPVIDRAILLEEQQSRARGERMATPLVSRATQKVGLVVGFLVYGAIWGGLFGVAYRLLAARLPGATAARRGWLLAALAGWSVAIFPFLKYPASPPGVGSAETIWYRQTLYFGFVILSIVGVGLADAVARTLTARTATDGRRRAAWPLPIVLYAVYAAMLYALMPANPDLVTVPASIVVTFRAVSLIGLALFWAVLGGAVGWLARERVRG